MRLHLVCYQDVSSKEVIPHNLCPDNACHYFTCVHTNPHIEIFQVLIVAVVPDIVYDLNHLECCLNDPIGLVLLDLWRPLCVGDMASVSTNNIAIADSVHLIDLVFDAKFVKACEQFTQELHNFLGILDIVAKLGEPHHICEQECCILKLINHLLIVFDTLKHLGWDQVAQQCVCSLNLDINDYFPVV